MRFVSVLQAPEGWRLPLAAPPPWPRTRLPFTAARSPPLRKKLPPPRCGPTPVSTPPPADMLKSCFGGGRGRASAIGSRSGQNHVRAPQLSKVFTTNGRTCLLVHAFHTHVTVYFSFLFFSLFLLSSCFGGWGGGAGQMQSALICPPGRCNPEGQSALQIVFNRGPASALSCPGYATRAQNSRICYWFTHS